MQLDETFPAVHPNPQGGGGELMSAFRTLTMERTWGGMRGIRRGLLTCTSDRKGTPPHTQKKF